LKGISAGVIGEQQRLVSRLAPIANTYQKVASSLELVLDNLLIQDKESSEWKSFHTTWNNTLAAETTNAYEKRILSYKEKGWTREKFHRILTIGCFPLHPLTAYLLCNLDFTVDRTALQFVQTEVKEFIQNQPLTIRDAEQKLNFIYPISLIDTFLENFASDINYPKYQEAYHTVAGSDDPHELIVLKALFLYHASNSRLIKDDREPHEEVLATLTGLSVLEVITTLKKLITRDVIFYKPEVKLYRFWSGIAPAGIEKEIEDRIKEGKENISVDRVVSFCQTNIEPFLGSKKLAAQHFVDTNKLVLDDWQFEYKVYKIDGFIRALSSDQTLKGTEERGFVAYILAESQAELQDFRQRVNDLLANSPVRTRIAVAIPSEETGNLATVLLKIQTLKNVVTERRSNMGVAERNSSSQAYEELSNRLESQVSIQARNLLKSCTYHCVGVEKIPQAERQNPQRFISILLDNLYPFVPPIDGVDKLKSTHITGREVVSYVSRKLLEENLTAPFPNKKYEFVDSIFVNRWGILKKRSQRYLAQEPTHERIKAGWDLISNMADLGEQSEKIIDLQKVWKALSDPPYGYSEYNFTMLLVGWLSYHRKEVSLKGNATILSAGKKSAASTSVEIKSLREWAETNILEKADDFVKKWIVTGNAKLIRRKKVIAPSLPQSPIDYIQAEHYFSEVQAYLDAGEPDPSESSIAIENRDRVYEGVTQIRDWFQPIEATEALDDNAPIESLLAVYPKLLLAPPTPILKDDLISVQPTAQQRDRQSQALQSVSEKIERLVDAHSEESETLPTEKACGIYKSEIQRLITQISQVASLPPHLNYTLQYSLQAAERRLIELKEAAKVRDCLFQIQNRYRSLGKYPTQQDYIVTRETIETLAQTAPAVKQEEEYEQILQELDRHLNDLTQKLEIWEGQSLGLDSLERVQELMGEVREWRYRFTEDESVRKTTKLLEYLEREQSKGQSENDAVKTIKATLSHANLKLERIRDVATSKPRDAFQSYQELMQITIPTIDSSVILEEYQQELEGFKVKGRNVLISEGFAKFYNLELKRLEDYARIKSKLQELIDLIVTHENFADVKISLEQALQNLEIRNTKLQEQQQEQERKSQDERIIQFICSKYKLPKINTVQFLEDGIKEIQNYQSRLHKVEPFAAEIDQIIRTLQDKIANHRQSLEGLRNRLNYTSTLKDLDLVQTDRARLEFIFKDSSEYSNYQLLQQQMQQFRDDLEKLQTLENRSQQSYSIASCYEVLAAIHSEQNALDQFQPKLTELRGNIQYKIQTYTQELDDFEHRSKHINTYKEAQKLHEELLKQSARYAQSELSDRYETTSTNIRRLIELLQISETENIKTLEACQSQLNKLAQWKGNTDVLDSSLQEHFDLIHAATVQTEVRLLQRQQGDAEKWLKSLENQATELQSLTSDTEKIKLANKLLHKIQREQNQHIEKLNAIHQDFLKDIECRCEAEIAKDCENQIKILFEQIPRPRRVVFYSELEALLSGSTEEFDG
jgi:predicted transcriptional regulator with HTH domain